MPWDGGPDGGPEGTIAEPAELASIGGAGLAALLLAAEPADAPALCIAVGSAVRRGLPTAARATVAGRSPLHGGLAEGQVGGSLGRRLARTCDALLLRGRAPTDVGVDGLLVIDERGAARFERDPALRGLAPDAAHARLRERFGDVATLRVGPAAERGARTASLASGDAHASFTGRGGLGAALAALGLKAVVVRGAEVSAAGGEDLVEPSAVEPGLADLARALAQSPRLQARAADGTFELAPARAARGEIDADAAERIYAGARGAARERVGCAGCPTPCGWSFDRAGSAPSGPSPGPSPGPGAGAPGVPARFGKVWALGPPLGLAGFDDALALAQACDRVGVDAKETGAALRVLAGARGALGDVERMLRWIDELGAGDGEGALLGDGRDGAARALGVAGDDDDLRGEPGRGVAARLGARVAASGADPMRTFPFLLEAGPGRLLALTGLDLPPGAEDPNDPAGKGRIVWWHERLVAALDATGFCAFSAAGLLADGELDLDGLARALGAEDGAALIRVGDGVVAARRALAERWGVPSSAETSAPPELVEALAEYRAFDAARYAAERRRARTSTPPTPASSARVDEQRGTPGAGSARLRPKGALSRALGPEIEVALARPRTWRDVLDGLPDAQRAALVRRGQPIAGAYRDGRRLGLETLVRPGDVVDLVVAIAGG